MKLPSVKIKRNIVDKLGIVGLCILFTGVAFHYKVSLIFNYYREFFFGLFFLLLIREIIYKSPRPKVKKELFFLCLFPVLLVMWSMIDPGRSLYGEVIQLASKLVTDDNKAIYIIRNVILYLPMVLYYNLRGLDDKEIKLISIILLIIAILSVQTYLNELLLMRRIGFYEFAENSRKYIAYNSYVPYLTFPILSGFYILFDENKLILKAITLPTISALTFFVFLSSSRQSMLFILITFIYYAYKSKKRRIIFKITIAIIFLTLLTIIYNVIYSTLTIDFTTISRFTTIEGATATKRVEKIVTALNMLNLKEIFMGAGLTSVIASGPHNDYVRWTQRVGLFIMIIGVLPFVLSFLKAIKLEKFSKLPGSLNIYINLALLFTLYHSFFGYPREDAFQAPYTYLGLVFWFGANRDHVALRR